MPVSPSDNEDEYFKKQEMERLRRQRRDTAREMAAQEKEALKHQHWMRCPKCGLELAEITFRGVDVDACFNCGGMFFDQGEIDKALAHREPGTLGKLVASLFENR